MFQLTRDRVTGMIGIALGIVTIVLSLQLDPSIVPDDVGAAVFPIIAAIIIMLTSIGLIISKPDPGKVASERVKPWLDKTERKRALLLTGTYLLYFFLLWIFGFLIASFIVMFIMCSMFSEGQAIAVWKRIVFAIVAPFLIYFAFEQKLGLWLPSGIFYTLRF